VALFDERLGAAGAVGAVLMVVALGLLTVGAERPRAVGPVATPRG